MSYWAKIHIKNVLLKVVRALRASQNPKITSAAIEEEIRLLEELSKLHHLAMEEIPDPIREVFRSPSSIRSED